MYEERPGRLKLYSLESRKMIGDLTLIHKILVGLKRLEAERMFPLVTEARTSGIV